jgi:nicotinate-nucleotide pyrophosphorylase (carboxylating)
MNIDSIIKFALNEDIAAGDVTTEATVPSGKNGQAEIIARQAGVIAGLDITCRVFKRVDERLNISSRYSDGNSVIENDCLMEISGSLSSILTAERVALNFLGRLSGIATLTGRFVKAAEGTNCIILDTRKTTPVLRELEKSAVKSGGGQNHRIGLFDMYLVKENHIAAAGGIEEALTCVFVHRKKTKNDLPVEVEVRKPEEIKTAMKYPIDRILLDNMKIDEISQAVRACQGKVELEVSGGVDLENIHQIAQTGVNYISVGKLTHSAPTFDLSLLVKT